MRPEPDALFDALIVVGAPAQVTAPVAEFHAAGINKVLALPVPVAGEAAEEAALCAAPATVGDAASA